MKSSMIPLAVVTGALLLQGCSSDEPAPPSTQQRAAPPAPLAQAETEVLTGQPEYSYDPTGKTDPFQSFVQLRREGQETETDSPLQRFDLSQLVVTAIVWGTDRPRALIEDPGGRGYVVSEGTPIGKNKGRITGITDNMVLVKETYVDFRDRATTKEVELRLYEGQGG